MSKNNGKQEASNIKGYVVKESVLFSTHIGFALAENPKAVQPFVTWRFTEDEGKVNMFWGHYFSDKEKATADYISRVGEHQKDYPYASIQVVDHLTGKRRPERFENVDIVASLNQIMECNTVFHRNDLGIDIASLLKSADSINPEDRHFLWLSRPSGTEMSTERMAYLRETAAHNAWRYYAERSSDPILAYAVTVTGKQDGKLMGNLYELDYCRHVPSVVMQSVDVKSVEATLESGGMQTFSFHKVSEVLREHGYNVKELRYCASDSGRLESALTIEREKRQALPVGQIDRHVQDLRAERIEQEAKRMLLDFRTVAAGFSIRDGGETDTQRFVEVSPHFSRLADHEDMERLRAAVPFKSLIISAPDTMQRQYAYVSIEEVVPCKINRRAITQPLSLSGKLNAAKEQIAKENPTHGSSGKPLEPSR